MEEGVLTALQEFHCTSGMNKQSVNITGVVQIHDYISRSQWKLGVIEGLNKRNDGHIRSVTICTVSGRTNRLIVCLYPLEVSTDECLVNEISKKSSLQAIEQQQDACPNQDVTVPQ